ncbi:2Fe-2S iron-sulfur cluster binding domain-containing protein [Gordonia pseudamarae]|uniref:2Fe-2S iron-sulfur cluster binding domain-containing protein n=1 Tax=Gordonia pseudamarae TaxID=2831662 RepID=A0ABX6IRE5_9ACTN|nr:MULTISPECIES: ferredoxin reductase [Gordonia]MBD0022756.1 ferredoxin reductase [Gordonia sp. (in: high G+C Gram-positive bacteria)]QHN28780.1 2Fe-2S iron-sulfur cluster binding domain-containing protein [Gordonia pseudamarae]QHN37655.1 2Fe-2S iron-sulfur cluster binding domain-containing protein [Gordonia pseudamarae]
MVMGIDDRGVNDPGVDGSGVDDREPRARSWRERFEAPVAHVSSQNRAANWVRAAAARITTPLLPDDYLHLANPLWSARELRGKIVSVSRETEDSATIGIKPGWGFSFDYTAGQYVGIGVLVDGRWTWRSYSLTSVPDISRSDKTISITVKAMPEGFLSTHLVNGLQPGTIVRLAAPRGEFVLPDPLPQKILFATAGSGITPIISMVRMIRHRGQEADIVLVHSAPTRDDLLFGDELAELSGDGVVTVHTVFTRSDGKLTAQRLAALCPDLADRQTWACGPAGFLEMLEQTFADAGVPDNLHLERFALERGASGAQGGEVTFGRSGRTATVDGATTLLEAGEQSGVLMPFGCRMGICQSCVVMIDKGAVRDLRTGREHVEGERVQTCVSAAAGDCTLDV